MPSSIHPSPIPDTNVKMRQDFDYSQKEFGTVSLSCSVLSCVPYVGCPRDRYLVCSYKESFLPPVLPVSCDDLPDQRWGGMDVRGQLRPSCLHASASVLGEVATFVTAVLVARRRQSVCLSDVSSGAPNALRLRGHIFSYRSHYVSR